MYFGSFQLDEANGELRRDGALVKLAPRQFRLLHLLARNAGRVVTRDEIQREIWGAGTFVDFQRNLNVCVAQLRAALEDDSESPRFIETAPRRGYRFVAAITLPPVEVGPVAARPMALSRADAPIAPSEILTARRVAAWTVAFACCAFATYLVVRPAPPFLPLMCCGIHAMPPPVRVAVLPFASDGLTSELMSAIGNWGGDRVAVIGRASVMRFAGKPAEAGRELDAAYIVEGTTERERNRVRIVASVVRTSDQVQVWAETFEGDAADTLGLQQRVTANVAAGIMLTVFQSKSTHALPDPQAEAFAAVAEQHVAMARSGRGEGSAAEFAKAAAAADSALKLDPHNGVAHNARGNALFWRDWNWESAGREFEAAIQANPSLATAQHDYAFFLVATGRRDEGVRALQRALALDPFSVRVHIDAGWLLLQARRFDEAIAHARRAQQLDPGLREADACVARALFYQGKQPIGAVDASDPFLHAAFSAMRGQHAEALDSLDRAYAARNPMMVFLRTEPAFDKLQGDPRFRELTGKMHF